MNLQLHLRTVFVGSGLVSVVLFVCMLVVALQGKIHRGFLQWTAATFTLALGMILIGFRGILPDFITFNVATTAILGSLILIHDGLAGFSGKPPSRKLYLPLFILFIAPDVIWDYLFPDARVRVVVSSTVVLLYSFVVLRFYYRHIGPLYKRNWLLPFGLTAQASIFVIHMVRITVSPVGHLSYIMRSDTVEAFLVILIFSMTIMVIMGLIVLNMQRTEIELRDATSEVNALRRIIPICASCKRIRDDRGYWNDVDAYFHTHTDIRVSHGLCPDCAQKLYPEAFGQEGSAAKS